MKEYNSISFLQKRCIDEILLWSRKLRLKINELEIKLNYLKLGLFEGENKVKS